MDRTTAEPDPHEPNNLNTAIPGSFLAGDVVLSSEAWVWAFKLSEYPSICAFCFTDKNPKELRTCSGCKLHRYCDATCQTADWKKEHKGECATLKAVSVQIASVPVHACENQFCGYFAQSVADLLVAKVANKFKLNMMEEVAGSGKMSPREIFKSFENPFPFDDHRISLLDLLDEECPAVHKLSSRLVASALGIQLDKFTEFYRIATHNAFPIHIGPKGNLRTAGSILYRHPLRRSMLPVCSDVNVLVEYGRRNLTLFAAEDIPGYTGLHDLRYKFWPVRDEYCWTPRERHVLFEKIHGFSCTCRKCATEYEAEVNPLKCVTVGCMERIPSDQRALRPCEQCGAISADRLEKFQRFMKKYDASTERAADTAQGLAKKDALLKELDAADLVHSDAYVRYLCGWALIPLYVTQGRYEAGWKLMQELVASIRSVYPTFHDGRAALLSFAAACPLVCMRTILEKEKENKASITKREKSRLISLLTEACTTCLDYINEARIIFLKLSGPDSAATKQCDRAILDLQFILKEGPVEKTCLMDYRYHIWYQA